MDTKLQTGVDVKSRIETLYYFLYEIVESFGVNDRDVFDTIKKGILDNQMLKEIYIYYKNNKKNVATITISIDWEEHRLRASTESGDTFELDPNKSIVSQISEISDIIIEHVENLMKNYSVTDVKTKYRLIEEYLKDDIIHEKAREFLGLRAASSEEEEFDEDLKNTIKWIVDQLSEVTITVDE